MTPASADEAQQAARQILSQPRFGEQKGSSFLDNALEVIAGPVRDFLDRIGDLSLGDAVDIGVPIPLWLLLILGLGLLAGAGLRSRRRWAAGGSGHRRHVRDFGEPDAGDLERRADEAERQGDAATAVRLRFRAGLLRLAESGVIELRSSTTARDAARAVRSPDMRWLVERFEAIAYGGHPASSADATGARERWRAVSSRTGTG